MGGLLDIDRFSLKLDDGKMAEDENKKTSSTSPQSEQSPVRTTVEQWHAEPPDKTQNIISVQGRCQSLTGSQSISQPQKAQCVTNSSPQISASHNSSDCHTYSSICLSDEQFYHFHPELVDYTFDICNKCGGAIYPSQTKCIDDGETLLIQNLGNCKCATVETDIIKKSEIILESLPAERYNVSKTYELSYAANKLLSDLETSSSAGDSDVVSDDDEYDNELLTDNLSKGSVSTVRYSELEAISCHQNSYQTTNISITGVYRPTGNKSTLDEFEQQYSRGHKPIDSTLIVPSRDDVKYADVSTIELCKNSLPRGRSLSDPYINNKPNTYHQSLDSFRDNAHLFSSHYHSQSCPSLIHDNNASVVNTTVHDTSSDILSDSAASQSPLESDSESNWDSNNSSCNCVSESEDDSESATSYHHSCDVLGHAHLSVADESIASSVDEIVYLSDSCTGDVNSKEELTKHDKNIPLDDLSQCTRKNDLTANIRLENANHRDNETILSQEPLKTIIERATDLEIQSISDQESECSVVLPKITYQCNQDSSDGNLQCISELGELVSTVSSNKKPPLTCDVSQCEERVHATNRNSQLTLVDSVPNLPCKTENTNLANVSIDGDLSDPSENPWGSTFDNSNNNSDDVHLELSHSCSKNSEREVDNKAIKDRRFPPTNKAIPLRSSVEGDENVSLISASPQEQSYCDQPYDPESFSNAINASYNFEDVSVMQENRPVFTNDVNVDQNVLKCCSLTSYGDNSNGFNPNHGISAPIRSPLVTDDKRESLTAHSLRCEDNSDDQQINSDDGGLSDENISFDKSGKKRLLDFVDLISDSDSDVSSEECYTDVKYNSCVPTNGASDFEYKTDLLSCKPAGNIYIENNLPSIVLTDESAVVESKDCSELLNSVHEINDCLRISFNENSAADAKSLRYDFPNITAFTRSKFSTRLRIVSSWSKSHTIAEEIDAEDNSELETCKNATFNYDDRSLRKLVNEYDCKTNFCESVINGSFYDTETDDSCNLDISCREFLSRARRKSTYDTPGIFDEFIRLCNHVSTSGLTDSEAIDSSIESLSSDDDDHDLDHDQISHHSFESTGFQVGSESESGTYTDESDNNLLSYEDKCHSVEGSADCDSEKRSSGSESDVFFSDEDELLDQPAPTFQRFTRLRTSFRHASIDLSVYGSFRRRSNSIACLYPLELVPKCTQSLELSDSRERRFSTSYIMDVQNPESNADVTKAGDNKDLTKMIDKTGSVIKNTNGSLDNKLEHVKMYREKYGLSDPTHHCSASNVHAGFNREEAGKRLLKVKDSPYLQKYLEKEGNDNAMQLGKHAGPRTSQILADPKIQKYLINRNDGCNVLDKALEKPKAKLTKYLSKGRPKTQSVVSFAEVKDHCSDESDIDTSKNCDRLKIRRTSSDSNLDKLKGIPVSEVKQNLKPSKTDFGLIKHGPSYLDKHDDCRTKDCVSRSFSCTSRSPMHPEIQVLVTDETGQSSDESSGRNTPSTCPSSPKCSSSNQASGMIAGFNKLKASLLKSKFYIPTFEEFKRRRFGSMKGPKKPSSVVTEDEKLMIKRTASVPLLNDDEDECDKSQNLELRVRKLSHDPSLNTGNYEVNESDVVTSKVLELPVPKARVRHRTAPESDSSRKRPQSTHERKRTSPGACQSDEIIQRTQSVGSSKNNQFIANDEDRAKQMSRSRSQMLADRLTRNKRNKSDLTGTQASESRPRRHKSDVTGNHDDNSETKSKSKHLKYTSGSSKVSHYPTLVSQSGALLIKSGCPSPVPKPRERARRKGTTDRPFEIESNFASDSTSSTKPKQDTMRSVFSIDRSLSKRESSESLLSVSNDVGPRRRNKNRLANHDRPVSANMGTSHKNDSKSRRPLSEVRYVQKTGSAKSSQFNGKSKAENSSLNLKTTERWCQSAENLNLQSGVTRSTSDVSDVRAEEKRREKLKKSRVYRSDPLNDPGKKTNQYCQGEADDRSTDDLLRTVLQRGSESLQSLDFDTDARSEIALKRLPGNKLKRISNVSSTSVDSGVVGHSSSREYLDEFERSRVPDVRCCIEVERVDSGIGYDISKDLRDKYQGPVCEDCDQPIDGSNCNSESDDRHIICKKCQERRIERKEAIQEIVDTEVSYGRDLKLIKEEFLTPMQKSSLLTTEQLQSIFLNLQELMDINEKFADSLLDAIELANDNGDKDFQSVRIGHIFLDFSFMFIAFENYCVHQAAAAVLIEHLEKEKELFRIFLEVSQTENPLLRRMNLKSFLMIPVQRIMKYPLLLSRLHKATANPHEDRSSIKESQVKIEEILEHINSKTKMQSGVGTKMKKLSVVKKTSVAENIELQKVAFEILGKSRNEAFCVHMGKINYAQPTEIAHWQKKGKGLKFYPVHGMIIAIGKSKTMYNIYEDQLFFPKKSALSEGILVLLRDKGGKYVLSRDPLNLEKCVISVDQEYDDVIEVQDINRDTLLLKTDDVKEIPVWLQHLKYQAKDLGNWRRRRNALPNIMISKALDS